MYLISIYFDEKSDQRIRRYIERLARHTGNMEMLDGNVPPHVTISAFYAEDENIALNIFREISGHLECGYLDFVSVGAFFPHVIYMAPVLNEYLQRMSEIIYKEVQRTEGAAVQGKYRPYGWMPHTTLAKHMTKEQMQKAFVLMQNQFGPFEAQIVKIGLAKTNPYTDLQMVELKNKNILK